MSTDPRFEAVLDVLQIYLDGLHHSDTRRLGQALHPAARYVTATAGSLVNLSVAEYLPIVEQRPSPASKAEPREERIVSIEFAGPVTAFARLECTIAPRSFIDLLTLVFVDDRWQIISKVFHHEIRDGD